MPSKKPRKDVAKRGLFHFKHDLQTDISPFINTFRSYLYESRSDKDMNKVRDLQKEVHVIRQIMTMKTGTPCIRYFDVNKAVQEIIEMCGKDDDLSVVCAETQMERCCNFIADKTGKEVVGFFFNQNHSKPKYVTDPFIGDFNLILIKMKNGKFGTASRFNVFDDEGQYFCIACRKYFKQSSDHTSACRIRCNHCFGMGKGPCIQELEDGSWIKCNSCRFEYKSQKCYDQHLITACSKKVKCKTCGKAASTRPGHHICGSSFCQQCKLIHPKNDPTNNLNYCYIKPQKLVPERDFKRVATIIYDIETHPVYISEIPKKRNIIPDPNDSEDEFEDECEDSEDEDGVGYYMNKIGDHNDDLLPESYRHDFPADRYCDGDEIDDDGIVCYADADTEAADNFNDDMAVADNMKANYKHVPNLLCAKIRCSDCMDVISDDYVCDYCDHTTFSWTTVPRMDGAQIVDDVCEAFKEYLEELAANESLCGIYCFAHNAARFDTHLVVKKFIDAGFLPDNIIMKGNSIIQTTFYGDAIQMRLHFRDTYRLIPVGLKAFQKTFGLADDIVKFDFPHQYNRPEFYDEELDSLPDREFFAYSMMKKADQKIFNAKYNKICEEMKESGEKYRLPEQLLKYCLQDVEVLYRGFVSHCKNLNEITQDKVDELDLNKYGNRMGRNSDIKYYSLVLRGSTIASLALYIFRLKYLKWETVALVPESGYQSTINQSKIAIAYMNFLVHKKKAAGIMHRDNGGEKKFGDMFVDGFDHVNNVVYQVMGCMYHGCIKCRQADRSIIQWVGKSAAQLYAETVARQKKLRENLRPGIQIVEIWECEIAAERKLDAELDKFIKEHEDTSPINLRRTLTGGRTGPLVLEAKANAEWDIKYFDICSLYPYINFTTRYPIKHPEIRYEVPAYRHPCQVPEFAIVKCKILPPKNLMLPIIPMKHESQLLFPLCGKCPKELFDKNEQHISCPHTDAERAFVVETSSMEIKYAMENEYKVLKIYHVLEYDEGTDDLFKGYVREFLRTKVEASIPPEGYETDPAVRQHFQALYREIYGIELGECAFNAGKRFIAKIFLNSLWGKFSMGAFEEKMVVGNSDLFKYLADPTIYDLTYHQVSDDSVMIRYKRSDHYSFAPNVNLVVSLWTTAAAKLHLYKFMKYLELDPNSVILYTDTDSIIYAHKKTVPNPLEAGDLLGQMTDEYPQKSITHYRSGGAKQYYLKYKDAKTGEKGHCCKIRGIVANAETERVITYKTLKYKPTRITTLDHTTIGPHHDFTILTRNTTKIYRTTCKKGIIWQNKVYPYGWDFAVEAYMPPWDPETDSFEVKKSFIV